jgi:hypothetical protein
MRTVFADTFYSVECSLSAGSDLVERFLPQYDSQKGFRAMMHKSYDNVVLEVAMELEATSKADFLTLLEKGITKKTQQHVSGHEYPAGLKHFTIDFIDGEFVEVTMLLPVDSVLGERPVIAEDVVRAFETANGPSTKISIHEDTEYGVKLQSFKLVQRHVHDDEFFARYRKITEAIGKLPKQNERAAMTTGGNQ